MTHTTHALLVLGMHRSGTSALTGALTLRGIQLGQDLMPPAEHNNPKGFWEHMAVINIHEQLLETIGHPWFKPGPLPDGWLHHPAAITAREQLRALIQTEFNPHPVWAIKDPRLCRLLPLWRSLLDELGIATSVVIIARDPREVATSLQKRENFAPDLSRELWLWHIADAIHGSHGLPRYALTYPRLLANPAGEIEALVESLRLPLPATGTDTVQQLSTFVEAQERHHQAPATMSPEWELATSIYRQMLHQPVPWDDIYTIARANTQTGLPLARALDDYAQLRARQRRGLEQTQQQLLSTQQELNRLWHAFNTSQHALQHTRDALEQARCEIDRTGQALDATQLTLDATRQERDQARQAFQHTQKELDSRTQWALELNNTLQNLIASRSWRWMRPLRALGRVLRGQPPHGAARKPDRSGPIPAADSTPTADDPEHAADSMCMHKSPLPSPETPDVSVNASGDNVPCLFAHAIAPDTAPGYCHDGSKLIAFYLPQYHWVEENSKWWGQGFTEWTNVVRAQPNFEGHYQPHLPSELGLYDLDDVDVMRDQAALAREYGIHGFCFYYYWFSGRRILERPLDNFLASDIEMPFCLCWANESWTRTWDGGERQVLLEQGYAPGDEERLIADMYPFLADPRYLKVDGKPMLVIYRIKAFPDPKGSTRKWQTAAKRMGLPGLHLVMVDFIDIDDQDDPRTLGIDAVVEFPPHRFGNQHTLTHTSPALTTPGFSGVFYDYPAMALHGVARPSPDFPLYRGLIPGWDNTARRQHNGLTVLRSTPECFALWLQFLRAWTRETYQNTDASFIFVNAWNEWGEGCHLEPDLHWGLAYLDEITRSSHIAPQMQQPLADVRALITRKIKEIAAHE